MSKDHGNSTYSDEEATRSFENSFWGKDDRGVETLMNRMRKAKQTCTELKSIFSARASLEEEYGKKLIKIAKSDLGKDETGELQKSLSRLRSEIETTGNSHLELSTKIKQDIEGKLSIFMSTQRETRKEQAAIIEKSSKSKSLKHANLLKIKEKYINEKTKANSLEAINSSATKDIEKMQIRQQKIKQLESEYGQLSGELEEATKIWQHDWRVACRIFQGLEQQRIEFLKEICWNFSNSIADVCLKDDESCERIRSTLQKVHATEDLQTFISERATGFDPDYDCDGSPLHEIPSLDSPLEDHNSFAGNPFSKSNPAKLFKKAFNMNSSLFNLGNSSSNSLNKSNLTPGSSTSSKSPISPLPRTDSHSNQASNEPNSKSSSNLKGGSSLASFYDDILEEEKSSPSPKNHLGQLASTSNGNLESLNTFSNESIKDTIIEEKDVDLGLISPMANKHSAQESHLSPPFVSNGDYAKPLFFVRVLYDYLREMEQELSIQQGQILAVLATHEDGWWEGEYVDPNTGLATRGIFPSNFTQRVDYS